MNAIVESIFADEDQFFAPSNDDFIDGLVAQHLKLKSQIQEISAIMRGEQGNAVHYFITANADRNITVGKGGLFDEEPAIKALDAAYWSKAIHQTNLLDVMPQARRTEWHEQIDKRKCPAFDESTVRATLSDLLGKRHQFFAERVDGIFKNLSGEHVTNSPAGFGKRFILAYMHTDYGSWYSQNYQRWGYINDLRCVIARFMGCEEPHYSMSDALWKALKENFGEWMQVDGNAFKIRLYKKGTAHIEVHPDMAWRLNATLAHLYPSAIPAEFRTKPKRKPKDVVLMQTPLSANVLHTLADMETGYIVDIDESRGWNDRVIKIKVPNSLISKSGDKHVNNATAEVLQSIGGVQDRNLWRFDYNPMPIINQIVTSGLVPDDKSHQYYPTPEIVAKFAIDQAEIDINHKVLEPSAGIGNLADLMPKKDNVTCVEVSRVRADVLSAKGYENVAEWDFISWADKQPHQIYDRIVMNPPFDRGQWKAHVEHALPLLKRGGRLVAILPESANGKFYLDGCNCSYPQTFENEFNNTSITVAVLVADRS
ncbi:MAG: DUF4942 domain-containing protein [Methylophilus sp.]|jgi:hypothetical protein